MRFALCPLHTDVHVSLLFTLTWISMRLFNAGKLRVQLEFSQPCVPQRLPYGHVASRKRVIYTAKIT